MFKNVQARIILILFLILVMFGLGLLFLQQSTETYVKLIKNGEYSEAQKTLGEIIKLEQANLEAYTFDYTYWDEMVKFVKAKDLDWAKLNIDPSLNSFRITATWIYNLDFDLIYATNSQNNKILNTALIPKTALHSACTKAKFNHFFVNAESGLMEIATAPIQSSSDTARQGAVYGYYIAGRLWDDTYLKQLSRLTDSDNMLLFGNQSISNNQIKSPGTIEISRQLEGWDGKSIATLNSVFTHSYIDYLIKLSEKEFTYFMIGSVFLVLLISGLITYWFSHPLRIISKSLDNEDNIALIEMQNNKTEFGRIATLINRFFVQKAALEAEIIQRIKAEKSLKESELRLRSVIENSPVVIWSQSTKSREMYFISPAIESLIGYSPQQITNNLSIFNNIVSRIDIKQWQNSYKNAKRIGMTSAFETHLIHKNGSLKTASILIAPGFDINGRICRVDGIAMDITEKKKLENQITHSDKMAAVGLLAAGVAHEFNNLLCAIMGNLELIKNCNHTCNTCPQHIDDATNASERAAELVSSLLSYSRSESKDIVDVNITDILEKTIRLIEKEIRGQKKKFFTRFGHAPIIRGIPGQLQQVFLNMLINATHATEENGFISVNTWCNDENIFIEIADNGSGIKSENIAKIFDPFFTTKSKANDKKDAGNGLGLFISYNIIKEHGGEISVKSGLSMGTEFTISLPLNKIEIARGDHSSMLNNCVGLIVEYDPQEAIKATVMIKELGGTCESCIWGEDAIGYLSKRSYDFILVDASNPAMGDFVRLLEHLTIKYPVLPVYITSKGPVKYQYDGYTKMAKNVIFKPFSQKSFIDLAQDIKIKPLPANSIKHTANIT